MRRFLVPLIALLLLSFSTPVFAEIELGASFTPAEFFMSEEVRDLEAFLGSTDDFDMIYGFHVGYSWWWLFYASVDSLIVPPWFIYSITAGEQSGIYRPGYINMIDVGIRPTLGPLLIFAEAGLNNIFIYKQDELDNPPDNLGVNLRIGGGLLMDWWSITVSGTSVFPNFDQMVNVLEGIIDQNPQAIRYLMESLIPSINVNLHF